jgi:hypothetical protein
MLRGKNKMDINYCYTVPDSHFWGSLDMFKNFLESEKYYSGFSDKAKAINYILVGINNMILQGYELKKKDEYETQYKQLFEDLYKLRNRYIGKKFTVYRWVEIIKVIKNYFNNLR